MTIITIKWDILIRKLKNQVTTKCQSETTDNITFGNTNKLRQKERTKTNDKKKVDNNNGV